jgi:hypothetical protein
MARPIQGQVISLHVLIVTLTSPVDSAYIFVGGLNYELTEGDVVAVFSQYVHGLGSLVGLTNAFTGMER